MRIFSCLGLIGSVILASPAYADEIPTVTITDVGPNQDIPAGRTFYLAGAAGRDLQAAQAIVVRKGIQIGFLQYTARWYQDKDPLATPSEAGVAKIASRDGATIDATDLEAVKNDIRQLRSQVDIVVVSHHNRDGSTPVQFGGSRGTSAGNDRSKSEAYQTEFAHAALDTGADLVFGHGTHTIQGVEIYKGKPILYAIGHSNFSGEQARHAEAAAEELGTARFVSAQNEYNLLSRGAEHDILPAAQELGLAFLPFFPLANGLFTGKFTRTERPADSRISRQRPHVAEDAPWDAIEAYAAYCADRGVSMLEATFGWLLARPALASVIAGATTPQQITANAAAGNAWRPRPEEVAVVDALFSGR